jgi:hypothetical protein
MLSTGSTPTEAPRTVLIGSAAVHHHDASILNRVPKDEDYLSLDTGVDGDVIDGTGILDTYTFGSDIASIHEVYTLKVSHSAWIIDQKSWHKHIKDIHLLKNAGAVLIPELYTLAYAQWEQRKGAKRVNLNQDKEEFFGARVRRVYEHDSIHAAVAFGEEPAFTKILAPGEEVLTSKTLFLALSEQEKRELVHEEVMVLSLERDLIPKGEQNIEKIDMYSSYSKQLQLLMTQYSKGWFPQWIIENYFSVYKPPLNYWVKFMDSDKKVLLPR